MSKEQLVCPKCGSGNLKISWTSSLKMEDAGWFCRRCMIVFYPKERE